MPEKRDIAILLALFIVSRLSYYLLGVEFDARFIQTGLQFIDPVLLEERLIESLFFYHAKPPLMNALAAIGIKMFDEHAWIFFSLIFHVLAFVTVFSVFALTRQLVDKASVAWCLSLLLMMSPALVLYETWFMYTLPACAMLTLSAWLLYNYLKEDKVTWGLALFICLAALVLSRAIFHFYWLLLILVILMTFAKLDRKRLVYVASLPVLICLLWYGKNLYLFGSFSASSLLGISLTNVTTLTLPRPVLQHHINNAELTRFAAVSRYQDLPNLLEAEQLAPEIGIPVLDDTRKSTGALNFNSLELRVVDQAYRSDALEILKRYPQHYLVAVSLANNVYFSPGSMSVYFKQNNRDATAMLRVVYNSVFYGAFSEGRVMQPHFGYSKDWYMPVNPGLILMALSFLVLLWASQSAFLTIVRSEWTPRNIVVGYMFGNLLMLYLAGTLLELSENNRYRFIGEPIFWLMVVLMGQSITGWISNRAKG